MVESIPWDSAACSDAGGRERNEDAWGEAIQDGRACWVVADGLGGHRGGEVAAQLAVQGLLSAFREQPAVQREALMGYLSAAHQRVLQGQHEQPQLQDMGTTLVTLLCDDRQALWGHVGDSRLYAFRDGCLIHQTRDHSVPQLLVNAGEIAPDAVRDHEDRARLLQALGTEGRLRPEIPLEPLIVQAGDAFLLCTDGFWEHVLEAEMESALAGAATPAAWLQAMEAVHRGRAPTDCDNHTALAVYLRVP